VVHLLDVNVLLALAWPNHIHHDAAHSWFASRTGQPWATCPLTQAGFVRISAQPTATKQVVPMRECVEILASSTNSREHQFWPQVHPVTALPREILRRLVGPNQVTDALLLDLAIRQGGKLATFDQRIENLLPADSPHRACIEILPIS
jgi:toxin-antitoxin system PIN domain toxin